MMNFKVAVRTLWKTPLVSLVAVLSLGLGIGVNSAVFSLFDQMLVRPLPVPEPERLVNLAAPGPKPGSTSCTGAGDCEEVFSYPMFLDLQEQQTVFTDLAAHVTFGVNLAYEGQTAGGEGMYVSGSYFPVLGLKPLVGRLLVPADTQVIGESRVVVLSYDYWRDRFGEDPDVVDSSLAVNGHDLTIVGVAPAGFRGTTLGAAPSVFVPISLRGLLSPWFDSFDNRKSYWAYVFGRLKPDVTLEQARTGINVPYRAIVRDVEAPLQEGMSDETLERFKAKEVELAPGFRGQSSMHRQTRAPMLLLVAVATVVLLIACANVANLLLARSATRAGEMAVRLAVGASPRKLVSQLLLEAYLLAVLGGLAGIAAAQGSLVVLGRILPAETSKYIEFSVDPHVLVFTAVMALATGILFGIFPALHGSRTALATALRQMSGQASGARSATRFRDGLVVAQIALSTALLVSAGLFSRSLANISSVDLGIKADNLVTFGISPVLNGYTPERSMNLFVRAEEELAGIPGVTGVAASVVPILADNSWGTEVDVQDFESEPDTDDSSRYNQVGPGYLRTLGMALLAGREFTAADVIGAPKVAMVNEAFAEKFGLGRDAVGKFMSIQEDEGHDLDVEIVGLVRNAKYNHVKNDIQPVFFTPYRQDEEIGLMNFYLRTGIDPEAVMAAIPDVIHGLAPNLPVEDVKTMTQQIRDDVFLDRFLTILSAAFAALATLLAAVGLYGVLAFTVARRTREIGLRMALGADGAKVRRMVLSQVGRMTLLGGVLGLVAALGIGQVARSQLFEVASHDPVALAASAGLLAVVALVSGMLPAYRASRVDPMLALRYE